MVQNQTADRRTGHRAGGTGGRPHGQLDFAILQKRHREPFADKRISSCEEPGFGSHGDLRLDPGLQRGSGAEVIEDGRIRNVHIVIHAIEGKGLLSHPRPEGRAELQRPALPTNRIGRAAVTRPSGQQIRQLGRGRAGLCQGLQTIQGIVVVLRHLDRIGQTQPVSGGVIAVGQGDGGLIRGAVGLDRGQTIGLVIRHGQHAIRIRHSGQVADLVIEVARDLAARQGLTEQLVHGIVGEADGLVLGRDSREQIVVAVIGIGFDLAEGIGGAQQPVAAIVGKGGAEPWIHTDKCDATRFDQ